MVDGSIELKVGGFSSTESMDVKHLILVTSNAIIQDFDEASHLQCEMHRTK